jgi:hypothetical protein
VRLGSKGQEAATGIGTPRTHSCIGGYNQPDTSDYVIAVGFGVSARGQASGVGWIDRARGWAADLWLGSKRCASIGQMRGTSLELGQAGGFTRPILARGAGHADLHLRSASIRIGLANLMRGWLCRHDRL